MQLSTEKEKLSYLLKKVDEITFTLNKVSEELRTVSASLKSLAVGQITAAPATPTPARTKTLQAPQEVPTGSSNLRSLDEIRMSFPEELETRLSFEEKGDQIIIKPKQFLGSENFAKIASAIRGMGGEYISAGKDSHFRVAKKKA